MSLSVPRRVLHVMNLNDGQADTVGRALRWGDAEAFLDEAGRVCAQIEGEIEVEEDGRRKTVKVRRTIDHLGHITTEHMTGRQDVVLRPQPPSGGGQTPTPT